VGPRSRSHRTRPVPPGRSEAVPLHSGARTLARQSSQSHTPVALFFVIIVFFFFSAQLISFSSLSLLSPSRRCLCCAVVRASSQFSLSLSLSLSSLENGCVGGGRRREERERGARVLRRRLLPPSGERHCRRSGRASFAWPPPSRSVPFGGVGSAGSCAHAAVWVCCSVDSGFFVLHSFVGVRRALLQSVAFFFIV